MTFHFLSFLAWLPVYVCICVSTHQSPLSVPPGVFFILDLRDAQCSPTGFSSHSPWDLSEKPVTQCILDEVFWFVIKLGSTGGGNGKPSQYICCENFMSCIKGPKMSPPGVQYATGEDWRRITNSPRMNGWAKADTMLSYGNVWWWK